MPPGLVAVDEFFNGLPFTSNTSAGATAASIFGQASPLGKSIQKQYRFIVSFFPNIILQQQRPDIFAEIGQMPLIRAFHVQSVTIPNYTFRKETQLYGTAPRSFPVLEHDGFEVKIDFEDDNNGTIGYFISWLQRLAIDPYTGVHTPPDFVKLPLIGVVTESDNGVPIAAYTLHDAFYLNASALELDYTQNSAVKYSITFNVDIINSFFPRAKIFNRLTTALMGL